MSGEAFCLLLTMFFVLRCSSFCVLHSVKLSLTSIPLSYMCSHLLPPHTPSPPHHSRGKGCCEGCRKGADGEAQSRRCRTTAETRCSRAEARRCSAEAEEAARGRGCAEAAEAKRSRGGATEGAEGEAAEASCREERRGLGQSRERGPDAIAADECPCAPQEQGVGCACEQRSVWQCWAAGRPF